MEKSWFYGFPQNTIEFPGILWKTTKFTENQTEFPWISLNFPELCKILRNFQYHSESHELQRIYRNSSVYHRSSQNFTHLAKIFPDFLGVPEKLGNSQQIQWNSVNSIQFQVILRNSQSPSIHEMLKFQRIPRILKMKFRGISKESPETEWNFTDFH